MADLLAGLLRRFQVCVISGGKFAQLEEQLPDRLKAAPRTLASLHIMQTCGTRYFRFDVAAEAWQQVYGEDLTGDQGARIVAALDEGADALGFRATKLRRPVNVALGRAARAARAVPRERLPGAWWAHAQAWPPGAKPPAARCP
jgi:phosphomannomutase